MRNNTASGLVSLFAITLLIASVIIHGSLLYFLKDNQATTITESIRENLISGDRRDVIASLNQSLRFGFDRIVVETDDHRSPIILGKEIIWSTYKMHYPIYFDELMQFRAGDICFYYSIFEGFSILGSVWIVLVISSIIPINSFVKKRQKIQEEQSEAKKNKAVVEVVSSIAHDLRAPLATFERLLHIPLESFPDMKNSIKESLNRVNGMIESLRYSEIELIIEPKYCVLDFKIGLIGIEAKSISKAIILHPPANYPERLCRLDPLKFERAWSNLASNAIDAAKFEVWIEVETNGAELSLRVIDDGPGVSPHILSKLFERGMTHGKPDGTGLGLAYVRQIIQGHGGDVTYRREKDRTIFECRLPNAYLPKEDVDLKNPLAIDSVVQSLSPKHVSIRLLPETLAKVIQKELASKKSARFFFSCDYEPTTDIVVTNDDEILFNAMDDGKELLKVKADLSESQILDRLTRKFNLS